MATGPEHYREAERLLEKAAGEPDNSVDDILAAAQAHALLALAAATAETVVRAPALPWDRDVQQAWSEAIS